MATIKEIKKVIGDQQSADYRDFTSAWRADGVNDYMYLNNNELNDGISTKHTGLTLNVNNFPFTISYWIRAASPPASGSGIGVPYLISNSVNCFFVPSRNYLGYSNAGSSTKAKSFSVIPTYKSEWVHVCCKVLGLNVSTDYKIYYNGIDLDKIATPSVTNITNTDLDYTSSNLFAVNTSSIGGLHAPVVPNYNAVPNSFWDGKVSDFRIWKKDVDVEKIRKLAHFGWEYDDIGDEIMRCPMSLSSHFENNVPVGLCRALDISGKNNHFIIAGQGTAPTLNSFY